MAYLSTLLVALQTHDLKPLITEVTETKKQFKFLSSLPIGQNLQPTSLGREWLRWAWGSEAHPLQITRSIPGYATITDGYGKESFDQVTAYFREGIEKTKIVFQNCLTAIVNFSKIPCSAEDKMLLIQTAKSAFWEFAASRIGFHNWATTLFQQQDTLASYKIGHIKALIEQQNLVITGIFKECLRQMPLAKTILSPPTLLTALESLAPTEKKDKEGEKELPFLIASCQELVTVAKDTVLGQKQYQQEFLAYVDNEQLNEKLQINAHMKLMDLVDRAMPQLQVFPLQIKTLAQVKECIALTYRMFIEDSLYQEIMAHLIAAAIDTNKETRASLTQLLDDPELIAKLPLSKNLLWQMHALRTITFRFNMPLKEIETHALPLDSTNKEQLSKLRDFFTLAAELADKSMA